MEGMFTEGSEGNEEGTLLFSLASVKEAVWLGWSFQPGLHGEGRLTRRRDAGAATNEENEVSVPTWLALTPAGCHACRQAGAGANGERGNRIQPGGKPGRVSFARPRSLI
jgi:hypothetical protein